MDLIARHHATGRPTRLSIEAGRVARAEDLGIDASTDDLWVAPSFWDIQFNGRWGISFSDATLTVEQVVRVVHAQANLGSGHVLPTLITASPDGTAHGIETITRAIEEDPLVEAMVAGLHLEGPWISGVDGYRGAHPLSAVRDLELSEFEAWWRLAKGRIALVTLAPERPGSIEVIRALTRSGVVVALGHTAADGPTLTAAREAGATLSTHLGNGIAAQLPRHPNPIWHQAADDGLSASFIADGHHVGAETLAVLTRAKGPDRTILVSDASPLAGLPPGTHGPWEVHPSGKIVVAGTPYLAGSNQSLFDGLNFLHSLRSHPADSLPDLAPVLDNPARLLSVEPARIRQGDRADLVLFRFRPTSPIPYELVATHLGDRIFPATDDPRPTRARGTGE